MDIWLVHVANGRLDGLPVRVKRDIPPLTPRAITADGAFHYVGVDGLAAFSDVYMVSLDSRTGTVASPPALVSQSVGHSFKPIWSPDGSQLAFKSGPKGPSWPTVSILTLGTGEERPLRPRPPLYMGPAFDWSPDGRFFLMQANPTTALRASEDWGLYRIDARTGEASLITPTKETGGLPIYLPDGRSIAFRQNGSKIVLRDLDSGKERTLIDTGALLRAFAVSPDGASVAYLASRGPDNSKGDVHVASISDGRSRALAEYQTPVVPNCCGDVAWSHDSRFVVFPDNTADTFVKGTTTRRAELWRIPAAGGRAEKMGLTADTILVPSISPDGRRLAFAQEIDRSGYWVLEDFLPSSELARPRAGGRRR